MNQAPLSSLGARGRQQWLLLGILGVIAVAAGVLWQLPYPPVRNAAQAACSTQQESTGDKAARKEGNEQAWSRGSKILAASPKKNEGPDPSTRLIRLGIGTVIVLTLCVVTLLVCKRLGLGSPAATSKKGQLSLVETLPVGNRCCLHLVQVGTHQVLAGVDASGLKSLILLPEAFGEALAASFTPPESASDTATTFDVRSAKFELRGPAAR